MGSSSAEETTAKYISMSPSSDLRLPRLDCPLLHRRCVEIRHKERRTCVDLHWSSDPGDQSELGDTRLCLLRTDGRSPSYTRCSLTCNLPPLHQYLDPFRLQVLIQATNSRRQSVVGLLILWPRSVCLPSYQTWGFKASSV